MTLAIFDLDNTLIAGDSDHAWGDFLISKGAVDPIIYKSTNDQFYEDYVAGKLDIHKYLRFALAPLTEHALTTLYSWRKEFMEHIISPIILEKGRALLTRHRRAGDYCLIITATNRFVTEPIAEALGVDDLIATDPEMIDGCYTGQITGTPSYHEGKVIRLREWLQNKQFDFADSWFYSDSHNDIPLLEKVGKPVAVDADIKLAELAKQRHWPQISLR